MKRGLVLMLSLFLLSPTIQAQTTSVACDTAHQTVAFVNGIFNDDDMSGASGSADASQSWEAGLEIEAEALLASGRSDVWDVLTRRFESKLIETALRNTRGRRIEAAQKLGIGRNTITRKIQELNLE